jgi:glycosyltransferase involved in cell wall biosynthesis
MRTSVIIPTYNRADLVDRLLSSFTRQTHPVLEYEIILVDDGSTDHTEAIASKWRTVLPNLRYFRLEKNKGQSAAHNKGLHESSGEYLLFTDDDCIPDPNWIAVMSAALTEHPVIAGAVHTDSTKYTVISENISQFHPFQYGMKARRVEYIAGANMGFRREVFDKAGCFQVNNPIPDMELIMRVQQSGFPIWFQPESIVLHDPRKGNLVNLLRLAARYSSQTIIIRNQYAELLATPFILRNSALLLLATPFLAVGKTAQIFCSNPKIWKNILTMPAVLMMKFAWCWGAYKGLRKLNR